MAIGGFTGLGFGSSASAVAVAPSGDEALFLREFGETIVYINAASVERSILAIVEREDPAPIDPAPYGHGPQLQIHVANNSTTGIAVTELDTGRDKIRVAVKLGEVAIERRIVDVITQDNDMIYLELR